WPKVCWGIWPTRRAKPNFPRMSPFSSSRRAKQIMPAYTYEDSQLTGGGVPLARLADEFGTPLYVYPAAAIRANYQRLAAAFAPLRPLICYAVKANANGALLR